MVKLNNDLINNIMTFAYPTKEQMEYWKMCHYINYYKVLKDIEDTIIEIKIERNGGMKCVFSLFSLSILEAEFNYLDDDIDYEDDEIIEFYNYLDY